MQNLTETEQVAELPTKGLDGEKAEPKASSRTKLSGRLISAASVTGLGSVITMALGLFGSIAIARNGGPAGYANYVVANMLVFVPTVICSCGIPMALSRHVASEEEHGNHEALRRTITTVLLLLTGLALLTGVFLGLNLGFFETRLDVRLGQGFALMLPLLLVGAAFADGVQGIYFGLLRPRRAIIISIAAPLATILYVLIRRTGAPLPIWGAVAAFYLGSAVVAVYCVLSDRLLGYPAGFKSVAPALRDLTSAAVSTLFMTFTVWSDRWIAGNYLASEALGSYAAAVVIIQAVLRVPKNMIFMLVPATARVATSSIVKNASFNRAMISHFGLFAALLTTVLMLAPGLITRTIFGYGFTFAAPALLWMAPSVLVSAISIPFISTLTGAARNRLVTYLLVFTLVPRIILLVVLTRRWSLLGTALATTISDSLLACCCIAMARAANVNFPLRPLLRPFVLGVLAYTLGLGALLLGAHPLLAIALALLVFVFDVRHVAQTMLRKRHA